MFTQPTISVVCPTYNSEKYIIETLKTVFHQDQLPNELIIVDDGSTDDTVKIIREYFNAHADIKTVIIENPHLGPGAVRNIGIKQAAGEWIAFLDSDDQWLPNKISTVARVIASCPEKNFFCHFEERRLINKKIGLLPHGNGHNAAIDLGRQLYFNNFFSTSAVVCKKDLILKHGLFDEMLMTSQDYELWLRLANFIKVCFIPKVLGQYFDRPGNVTSSKITKRIKNTLKISFRHRQKVGIVLFVIKIFQIIFRYVVVIIKLIIAKLYFRLL